MSPSESFVDPTVIRRVRLQLGLALTALLLAVSYGLLLQGSIFAPSESVSTGIRSSLLSNHATLSVLFFGLLALPVAVGPLILVHLTGSDKPTFPQLQLWSLRAHGAALALAIAAIVFGGWNAWPHALPTLATHGPAGACLALSLHLLGLCLIFSALSNLTCALRHGLPSPHAFPLWGFATGALAQLACAVSVGAFAILLFFADRMTTTPASPLLLPRLVDFVETTALLSALLPAIAVSMQVVARSARRPVAGRWSNPLSLVLVLGLGLASSGLALVGDAGLGSEPIVRSAFALLLLVPGSTLALNLLMTLRGGAVRITGTTLFALSAVLCMILGAAASLFLADLSVAGPLWLTSVRSVAGHYLWLGASLLVVAAFVSAHAREVLGSDLTGNTVVGSAGLVFVGAHLALLPRVGLGLRGLWVADADGAVHHIEAIALVGSLLLVAGLALFAVHCLRARLDALQSNSPGDA